MDIGKHFFTKVIVVHWNRLTILGGIQRCADVALGGRALWWAWKCWVSAELLEGFEGFSKVTSSTASVMGELSHAKESK